MDHRLKTRKDRRGRRSNFRCAAIRSPVVWRPEAASNAVGYAKFYSSSHHAVIRVYDEAGNVIDPSTLFSRRSHQRTTTAFRACVACFRCRTIDMSRSLIAVDAAGRKLSANASRNT